MWSAREKWHTIGVRFKIGIQNLKVIGKDGDVDHKFTLMVIKWLERGDNCTWNNICDVLRHHTVDMGGLATKIGMIVLYFIFCKIIYPVYNTNVLCFISCKIIYHIYYHRVGRLYHRVSTLYHRVGRKYK